MKTMRSWAKPPGGLRLALRRVAASLTCCALFAGLTWLAWHHNDTGSQPAHSPVPALLALGPLTDSPPVTLTSGQVLRGMRITCSDHRPAVVIPSGVVDVRIEGNEIGPCSAGTVGILAEPGSQGIVVRKNVIHGVATGMWAQHAHHPVIFTDNYVYDIFGPFPRGQMIQLDNVQGGQGQSIIAGNTSDWFARTGPTKYEDHINVYMSSGTLQSPILIEGNRLRGGDSDTGAGITVGDGGGEHITVAHNVVVAVPNTGIGVAAGNGITVADNLIYNVYGPQIRTKASLTVLDASEVTLRDNAAIASYCEPGGTCDRHMGLWIGPGSSNVAQSGNNWYDLSLTSRIWDRRWDGRAWVSAP